MPVINIDTVGLRDFSFKWLSALRGFMPLTDKELLVLAEFLALFLATKDTNLFRTSNRRQVRDRVGISNHNLNNYINALKSKNAIFVEPTSSGILKTLIPDSDGKVEINIVITRSITQVIASHEE